MLSLMTFAVYGFTRKYFDRWISILIILSLSLSNAFDFLIYDMSHSFKYFFPMLALWSSLNLIKKPGWKPTASIFTWLCLAQLSHEASFTFAYLILCYNYFLEGNKPALKDFILILPSFIWILARVFIWGMPDSGSIFSVQNEGPFVHRVA